MSDDQTIDEGPRGFLDIFSSNADTPDTPDTDDAPTTDQAEVAADATAPDEDQDDGADLSAEERVAANLAAAMGDEGIEVPEPGDTTTEAEPLPEGEIDLETLTPEQLRVLAEEAIKLRAEVSTNEEQRVLTEIQNAENQVAGMWQQTEQRAETHYAAELRKRISNARKQAEVRDDGDAYFEAEVDRQRALVEKAKHDWLKGEAEDLGEKLQAYRQEQLKPFYARQLVKQAGLPPSAVKELLEDEGLPWQRYPKRVQELVAMRDILAENQTKADQKVRAEGRKRLIETAVVVPASGRAKPFKRKEYEGTAAEGLSILKTMSKMRS